MTIVSYGYPGSLTADSAKWAWAQLGLGLRMWVRRAADCVLTPVPAGTRQLTLSVGRIGDAGIQDEITAAETVALPVVAAGTRYFMVVARRTFGTTNKTTIEVIDGGTTGNVTLPARTDNRGVAEDQPLWLVPLSAGSSIPGTPIDLRVIGSHGAGVPQASSDLVRQFYNHEGAEVVIGATRWRRGSTGASSATWSSSQSQGAQIYRQSEFVGSGPDFTGSGLANRAIRDPTTKLIQLDLQMRYRGAVRTPNSTGNFSPDVVWATLLRGDLMPDRAVPLFGQYLNTTGAWYGFSGVIQTTGVVVMYSGQPGVLLNPFTAAGDAERVTIRAQAIYYRES